VSQILRKQVFPAGRRPAAHPANKDQIQENSGAHRKLPGDTAAIPTNILKEKACFTRADFTHHIITIAENEISKINTYTKQQQPCLN